MRALVAVAMVLALSGCATARRYATCENAQRAIVLAQEAVERVCRAR